jgi:hypothetical protein
VPPYHFHKLPGPLIRHLVLLPILPAAPYLRAILFFTFVPRPVFLRHSLFTPTSLPPRHLAFHFRTTPGLPQALPLNLLATSAPACFLLSNHVRSSSGTPTFEFHEQVVPTVHWVTAAGGVSSIYLTLGPG